MPRGVVPRTFGVAPTDLGRALQHSVYTARSGRILQGAICPIRHRAQYIDTLEAHVIQQLTAMIPESLLLQARRKFDRVSLLLRLELVVSVVSLTIYLWRISTNLEY